jgi:hypothetical protein
LNKSFSQTEKNLMAAAKRKASHLRCLGSCPIERKTAQQRAKFASEINEKRKYRITPAIATSLIIPQRPLLPKHHF